MLNLHAFQKKLPRFFTRLFIRSRGSFAERMLEQLGFRRSGPDTLTILDQGQLGYTESLEKRVGIDVIKILLTCKLCRCTIYREWSQNHQVFFTCYTCGHLHQVERHGSKRDIESYSTSNSQAKLLRQQAIAQRELV